MSYEGCDCWWAEATEDGQRYLRTYEETTEEKCPGPFGYHNASIAIDVAPIERSDHGTYRGTFDVPDDWVFPEKCDFCSYLFTEEAHRQGGVSILYRRADNGELFEMKGPQGQGGMGPPGMLFHCSWMEHLADRYPDGIVLGAVCPNGQVWIVDGSAYPEGKAKPGAWTRTGDPRSPETLTVTPSIIAGDYHGFLQNGRFTSG